MSETQRRREAQRKRQEVRDYSVHGDEKLSPEKNQESSDLK